VDNRWGAATVGTPAADDLWAKVGAAVRVQLSEATWNTWFQGVHALDLSDDTLILGVPSSVTIERLRTSYHGLLTDAAQALTGVPLDISLLVDTAPRNVELVSLEQLPPPVHTNGGEDTRRVEEPVGATGWVATSLNPRYTFDQFVIGASNRFAHAAAMAVAEAPASAYNPLFIYGGAGLGKTHLLHAIGKHSVDMYPHLRVKYVSSETFTNDFINAIKDDRSEAFQRRYREADILLVDDIQFLESKERTQEEFFHTFNALHNANKQIVMSSDRPPKKIATLEDRLRSRFEWGLITDIQPPDLETRIAILKKKADMDHLTVSADVLGYIASRVESNIRELEGALIRVIAYASLNQTTVTLDLAEEVLGHLFPTSGAEPVRTDTILHEVAAYFGVSVDDLKSQNRSKPIVSARQIAMYLLRDLTELSLPKIGEVFGGRDHTTVLHAYQKMVTQLSEKRQIYYQIQDLTSRIRNRSGG
jgi:chromosomal replication initiator protein